MSQSSAQLDSPLDRLPLVTLYLTERCNSRCRSCDYWRHGRTDLTQERLQALLPSLERLQTRVALISGGEPLLHPDWAEIALALRQRGLKLWLLTSGLSLAKHATRVAQLFDSVTVSLDGTDPATYAAIRGLDAFERVCTGIRCAADAGAAVGVRVTVQRANFRQLPRFVALARSLGARQVSFLAVDVASPHAFGRSDDFEQDLALHPDELPQLEQVLGELQAAYAAELASGFIAESPRRLARLHQYFSAVCGVAPFPPVRCNVFEYAAVVGATARVSPCFFIPGPSESAGSGAHSGIGRDLESQLNSEPMRRLRQAIRRGERAECKRCVCSLWREPAERSADEFLLRPRARA